MPYLEFLSQSSDKALAIKGTYHPILVGLSVLVAVVAAYASLGFAGSLRTAEKRSQRAGLLAAGSLTMGIGVWAMHFIGMMAFRMPMSVGYDLRITLFSVVPGCLASAVAIRFISSVETNRLSAVLSGVFMGVGIGAMHFTGMAAMRMPARIVYDPWLFALSGVVAIFLATVALHLNQRHRLKLDSMKTPWASLGVASLLGGAVAAMHYTGMAAAYFIPDESAAASGLELDPAPMSVLLALTAVGLVSVALFVVRQVCVSDTGKGMSEETRSRLFDLAFARVGSRINMGIGLYQARATVEKHGGGIAVESVQGEGSKFTIHLPEAGRAES